MAAEVRVGLLGCRLRRALRVLRRFTGREGHPTFSGVRLLVAPGRLVVEATDRFVYGQMRLPVAGFAGPADGLDMLLWRQQLRALMAVLPRDHLQGVDTDVELAVYDGEVGRRRLEVLLAGGGRSGDGTRLVLPRLGHATRWPPIHKLYPSSPEARGEPLCLNPALVAPFARAARILGSCGGWRWSVYPDRMARGGQRIHTPIRIDIGDQFTGLVMTAELSASVAWLDPDTTVAVAAGEVVSGGG